jgi:hypothetical protein
MALGAEDKVRLPDNRSKLAGVCLSLIAMRGSHVSMTSSRDPNSQTKLHESSRSFASRSGLPLRVSFQREAAV